MTHELCTICTEQKEKNKSKEEEENENRAAKLDIAYTERNKKKCRKRYSQSARALYSTAGSIHAMLYIGLTFTHSIRANDSKIIERV